MFKKFKNLVPALALFLLPVWVLAQSFSANQNVDSLQGGGELFLGIINSYVVPIIFALAFVYFLIGVFKYVKGAGDETERTKGKDMIIWGVVGLFVMSAVWGLVKVVKNTVNIPTGDSNVIPDLPR